MALKIYGQKATQNFWEKHWQTQKIKDFFSQTDQSPLLPIFLKHLPQKGKILEAGCGPGHWVFTLTQKGFNIIGIDNARKTIKTTKKAYPKLNLKAADLLTSPFKKESFNAIICLGVLEHFESQKKLNQTLEEIKKLLKNEGLFFCSVPYYNPVRIIKNSLGLYPKKGYFYQYAFSNHEFSKKLKNQNFKIIKVIPLDSYIGIKQELFPKLTSKLYKSLRPRSKKTKTKLWKNHLFFFIKKILQTYPSRLIFSHMLLFIAKKSKEYS